jgi:drug/metabolite transporter (DMT)-like permease
MNTGFVYLLAIFLTFIAGISPIIYRILMHEHNIHYSYILFVSAITFIIVIFGFIMVNNFHPIIIDHHKNIDYNITIIIVLLAIFDIFLYNILYYIIINHSKTHYSLLTVITALYPAITILVAYYIFKEQISLRSIIALIVIFICLIIIILDNNKK